MTLRQTQIIEWSTTPKELRRIADEIAVPSLEPSAKAFFVNAPNLILKIKFDEGQWQAEQVEEDNGR